MTSLKTTEERADLLCRQLVARALAAALADPRSSAGHRLNGLPRSSLPRAWTLLAAQCGDAPRAELGLGEIPPASADVDPLIRWLGLDAARREAAYQAVFGLVISRQCPPYETEYVAWKDTTHRAQKLADIAGFYNAFGLEPDSASPERPDHVSLELEFAAFLLQKLLSASGESGPRAAGHQAVCRDALKSFVAEHVAWWTPTFARCLQMRVEQVVAGLPGAAGRADVALLGGLARILAAWVAAERRLLGIAPVRRLIGPEVPPLDSPADGCGSCGTCETPAT